MKFGIYCIKNIYNNKKYIGRSLNIDIRFKNHKNKLNKGIHHSNHLQSSWNKYGEKNFIFEILEYCNENLIKEKERFYIDLYQTENRRNGYNMQSSIKYDYILPLIDDYRKYGKKVYQYDLNGNFIKEWNNASEASKYLNILTTQISQVCRGKTRFAKNFVFSYSKNFILKEHKQRTKLKVKDIINNSEKIYNSITEFCKINNISDTSVIHLSLKKRNGKYKNFLIEKYKNEEYK